MSSEWLYTSAERQTIPADAWSVAILTHRCLIQYNGVSELFDISISSNGVFCIDLYSRHSNR